MTIFNGTPDDDTFTGSAANDVFNYGNLTFSGGTIVAGGGNDTYSGGGGFDVLTFANLPDAYFRADRIGDDLTIGFSATAGGDKDPALGSVRVVNFYAADGSGLMDRVEWADAYANCTITGGVFRAGLYSKPDNVLFRTVAEGSSGNDSIVGSAVDDDLSGRLGNDTLVGLGGSDFLGGDAGNDRLDGGAADDDLSGDTGNDTLIGGTGNDTLNGSDGIDTADYTSANSAISVNLQQFSARGVGAGATVGIDTLYFVERVVGSGYNDSLVGGGAFGVTLSGGAGNDTLIGGAVADSLLGGAGADFFDASASGTTIGGLGNDTMDGGAVLDRINYLDGNSVSYAASNGAVTVNLATGIAFDGVAGTDTLRNIDFVTGSTFSDRLTGSSGRGFEMFTGGLGNDTIDGGAITDTLNGRDYNRAVFSSIGAAVNVDLAAGTATGQGNDTLIHINRVRGSELADTIRGSNRTDVTESIEGRRGNDLLDGRGGLDLVRYQYAGQGVSVNLATGVGLAGAGDQDTLIGIEGVRGSNFNDSIVGGNAANAALEFFRGMGGNDTIDGGAGFDRVDYVDSMQGVRVTLGGTGSGTAIDGTPILNGQITYAGTAGATIGTDTLRNIESVRGSDFTDVIAGSSIATEETFEGRAGNDIINGISGIDRVSYHTSIAGVTVALGLAGADGSASDGWGGTDRLRDIDNVLGSRDFADRLTGNELANRLDGQGGNDLLSGGLGIDTLIGGNGNDVLGGGGAVDVLSGGAGNDLLNGGDGSDLLTGGTGLDAFRFSAVLNGSTNVDRISDYAVADDTLQLDDAYFAGIGALGTLAAGALALGTHALDTTDRIVYDSATGRIYFDADGSGAGAQVLFASVTAGTALTASDFAIV